MVDLRTDLQDGLLLRSLVLQLTDQHIPAAPHTSFPITLAEKMKNINIVFSVLDKEGLEVVRRDNGKT